MSLVKCHECGNEVSTEATGCPKCGAKVKTKNIGCGAALGGLLIVGIVIVIFNALSPTRTATDPAQNKEPKVNFDLPLVTKRSALVCPESILFDVRENSSLKAAMDAHISLFGHDEAMSKTPCEEWKEGIPIELSDSGKQDAKNFDVNQKCGMAEFTGGLIFTCDLKNKEGIQPNTTSNTPQHLESPDITKLTETEFDNQFRCPETISDENESLALADSAKWYFSHYNKDNDTPQQKAANFINFRTHLLEKHHCDITLRNIQSHEANATNQQVQQSNSEAMLSENKPGPQVKQNIEPKAVAAITPEPIDPCRKPMDVHDINPPVESTIDSQNPANVYGSPNSQCSVVTNLQPTYHVWAYKETADGDWTYISFYLPDNGQVTTGGWIKTQDITSRQ